jgi:hypothetical protein
MKTLRNIILSAAVLIASIGLTAAKSLDKGNGNITTETRTTEAFSKIEASSGVKVFISQSDSYKVEVSTDSNLQVKVKVEVKDGVLHLSLNGRASKFTSLRINVSFKELKALSVSSGSNVKSESELALGHFKVEASSGSVVNLILNSTFTENYASSGSNIDLSGKTNVLLVEASSGANVTCKTLESAYGKIAASSGANIKVFIVEAGEFNASSGGNIGYKSGLKEITTHKSSGGNVYNF